jgi:hypothetical protein
VFDGSYSGLLHFTLRGGPRDGTEFKFDYPPRNGDTTYGALGYVFEVLDVTNTSMRYKWLSIPGAGAAGTGDDGKKEAVEAQVST